MGLCVLLAGRSRHQVLRKTHGAVLQNLNLRGRNWPEFKTAGEARRRKRRGRKGKEKSLKRRFPVKPRSPYADLTKNN
jgi:hypothetical protein